MDDEKLMVNKYISFKHHIQLSDNFLLPVTVIHVAILWLKINLIVIFYTAELVVSLLFHCITYIMASCKLNDLLFITIISACIIASTIKSPTYCMDACRLQSRHIYIDRKKQLNLSLISLTSQTT